MSGKEGMENMKRNIIEIEKIKRIMKMKGREVREVGNGVKVGRKMKEEVMKINEKGKKFKDRSKSKIEIMEGEEMLGGDLKEELEEVIRGKEELRKIRIRIEIGIREVKENRIGSVI